MTLKIVSMWYGSEEISTRGDAIYQEYYKKLEGKLDAQKEEYIVSKYKEMNKISQTINDLEDAFEEETITKEYYDLELQKQSQLIQQQEIIEAFYEKYQYCKDDREHRYIVDENGWNQLIGQEKLDYLLVLLFLLIFIPVFCTEYETDMNRILLCSKNGRIKLAFTVVGTIVKKSLLSIFVNGALLCIPALISNLSKVKYLIPLPTGMLYGVGYFSPDKFEYRLSNMIDLEVEKYLSFKAFTKTELFAFMLCVFFIMIGMISLITMKYVGISPRKKKNPISLLILTLVLLTGVCGCSESGKNSEEIFYQNRYVSDIQITDQYIFTIEGDKIAVQDRTTGQKDFIVKDVFTQSQEEIRLYSIFATNRYLYYSENADGSFNIYRVNLSDFSEEWIYSKKTNSAIPEIKMLAVSDSSYYYCNVTKNIMYIVDRKGKGEHEIVDAASDIMLSNYGDIVYYRNSGGQLVKYDIKYNERIIINGIHLRSSRSKKDSSYYIYDNYCYYTNMLDHNYVYRYDLQTNQEEKLICNDSISKLWANDSFCYYVDANEKDAVYRRNIETNKTEKISVSSADIIEHSIDNNQFFIRQLNSEAESTWINVEDILKEE